MMSHGIGSSLWKCSTDILSKVSILSNRWRKAVSVEQAGSVDNLTNKDKPSLERLDRNSSSSLTRTFPSNATFSKSNSSIKKKTSIHYILRKSSSYLTKKRKPTEEAVSKSSSHLAVKRKAYVESQKIPSYYDRTERRSNQLLDCQRILNRVRETLLGFDEFNNFNRRQAASDSTITERAPVSEGITKISTMRKTPIQNGDQLVRVSTTRRSNHSPTRVVSVSTTKKINAVDEQIVAVAVSPSEIDISLGTVSDSDSAMLGDPKGQLANLTFKTSSYIEREISMHPMNACAMFPVGITSPMGARSPNVESSTSFSSPDRSTLEKNSVGLNTEPPLQKKRSPLTKRKSRLRKQHSPQTNETFKLIPKGSPPKISRSRSVPIGKRSYNKADSSYQTQRPLSTGTRHYVRSKTITRRTKEVATQRGLPETSLRTNSASVSRTLPSRDDPISLSRKTSTRSRLSRFSRIDALATPKRYSSNVGLISSVTAKRIAAEEYHTVRVAQELQEMVFEQEDKNIDKPLGLSHNNRVAIQSFVKSLKYGSRREGKFSENKIEKPRSKIRTRETYSANIESNTRNVTQKKSSRRFANFSNVFSIRPAKSNNNQNKKPNIVTEKSCPQGPNKVKSRSNDQQSPTPRKTPLTLSRPNSVPNSHETKQNDKTLRTKSDLSENTGKLKNKNPPKNIKGLNVSIKKSRIPVHRSDNSTRKKFPTARERHTVFQAPKRSIILAKSSSLLGRFSPISEASSKGDIRSTLPTTVSNSEEKWTTAVWLETDGVENSNSHLNKERFNYSKSDATGIESMYHRSRTKHMHEENYRTPHRRQTHPLPRIYDELTPPVKNYLTPEEICKISMRINSKDNCSLSTSQRLSQALKERLHKLEMARRRFQSNNIWATKSSMFRINKNRMISKKRINHFSLSPSIIPIIKEKSHNNIIPEEELSSVSPPCSETKDKEKAKENKSARQKSPAITPEPPGKGGKKKSKPVSQVTIKRERSLVRIEESAKRAASPRRNEDSSKRRKCIVSKIIIMNKASSTTEPESPNSKNASVSTPVKKTTATQLELDKEVARTKENKSPKRTASTDQATFVSSEHEYMKKTKDPKGMCRVCTRSLHGTEKVYTPTRGRSKTKWNTKVLANDFEKTIEGSDVMTTYNTKRRRMKTMSNPRYTKRVFYDCNKPMGDEDRRAEGLYVDGEEETLDEVEVDDVQDLEQKVSEGLSLDLDSAAPLSRVPIIPDSVSDFMNFVDYDAPTMRKIDSQPLVPETDWRLITALAKKREIDEERERMAEAFHKMWIQEREENQNLAAEQKQEYEHYLRAKRAEERLWHEQNRLRHVLTQQRRREQVLSAIKNKRDKAFDSLTKHYEERTEAIVEKAIEEDARTQLATDKRSQLDLLEAYRLQMEQMTKEKRREDARQRRTETLKKVSQMPGTPPRLPCPPPMPRSCMKRLSNMVETLQRLEEMNIQESKRNRVQP